MDVSHSKVKTFRRCKCAYHNRYVLGLKKRIKSHALTVGSVVHHCIEKWSHNKPYKTILKKAREEESKMFEEEIEEFGSPIDLAEGMMKGYTETYEVDKCIAVEQKIRLPLIDDIDFIGYVDAIVERDNGEWLKETKTCKKFPDESIRMSDIQTVMYRWALPQIGFNTPRGVVWDYLRKKLPVIPEPLKNGGLSVAQKLDTTHDIYLKALKEHGLDVREYSVMLNRLKEKENNFHRRIILPFSKKMEIEVLRDFKETAIEIKNIGHICRARNLTRDCSWCDFNELCQAQLKNLDEQYIIKKNFTTREQRDAQEKRKKSKHIVKNKKG